MTGRVGRRVAKAAAIVSLDIVLGLLGFLGLIYLPIPTLILMGALLAGFVWSRWNSALPKCTFVVLALSWIWFWIARFVFIS